MPINSPEHDGVYILKYCSNCDASPHGGEGDNTFLYTLGELQKEGKVDLILGSCVICKGITWRIRFVLK